MVGNSGGKTGRFTVRWWPSSSVLKSKTFAILDPAIGFAEELWATDRVLMIQVLIDDRDVVWERPTR